MNERHDCKCTVEARFSGHQFSGKPQFKGHSSGIVKSDKNFEKSTYIPKIFDQNIFWSIHWYVI